MNSEDQTLKARVEQLEGRLRTMARAWMLALVATFVLGLTVQHAASESQVLRLRTLELVDAADRPRIVLSTLRGWPEITILDTAGHGRVGLSMDPGESTSILSLAGRDPRSRLVLMPGRLTVGDMIGDHVSLTMEGLKRIQLGGCRNCADKTLWSVP